MSQSNLQNRFVDQTIALENASLLDVAKGELIPQQRIVIRDGRIVQVGAMEASTPLPKPDQILDIAGKTVMPGLCDAHVHVIAWTANVTDIMRMSPMYTTARAAEIMDAMLMRGFTTVRDEAGADYGLAWAVEEGYLTGPRILFCGQALSQTGGHGDTRGRGEQTVLGLGDMASLGRLCDGVDAVRVACRDEIRKGANHIKLMLSGGVASPTDRISNTQFSLDEIRAAVEEAEMAGLYVTGHTYTAKAVNRAIECGVRSLEHCNLIDESSIELFLKHNAFMVPTLAAYDALAKEGLEAGLAPDLYDKIFEVKEAGLQALSLAHDAGVNLVYGSDLLGQLHQYQLTEFAIRSQVQAPIDIIRAATINAAELFNERGETGVIVAGARADLLVIDGDPLTDLACLQKPEKYLKAIMKGGVLYKNELPM
ncbi:MAG: amidohydrolase family protein [Chloroflexota bacterium]